MAELTIDTTQLVEAAITAVFAKSDPAALAEAMAQTVLEKQRYGRETVLEELIAQAVQAVARRVVDQILRENEEKFKERLFALCGGDIIDYCAQQVAARMRTKP